MSAADGSAVATLERAMWRRFLLVFAATYLVLFGLARLASETRAIEAFNEGTAAASVGVARLLDPDWLGRAGSEILLYRGRTLVIENGCNGIDALALLLAGIIAYPCARRAKWTAAIVGSLGLLAVNHIRLVGLILLADHYGEWFEYGHLFIGQTVVVVAVCAGWFVWARQVRPQFVSARSA